MSAPLMYSSRFAHRRHPKIAWKLRRSGTTFRSFSMVVAWGGEEYGAMVEHEPTWVPNLRRTLATWLQLGPNFNLTGVKHGAPWACLDASWVSHAQDGKLGPRQAQRGEHGRARPPHQSKTTLEVINSS